MTRIGMTLAAVAAALGLASPALAGSYTNTVLAAETTSGEDVVVIAGNHEQFPYPGADWDDLIIKVGDRVYSYKSTSREGRLTVAGSGSALWVAFSGPVQVWDVTPNGPVARGGTTARLVVRANVKRNLPQAVIDFGRKVDYALPLMLLDVRQLRGGLGYLRVGGTGHRLQGAGSSGHAESSSNAVLNRATRLPVFMLYDYAAGARPHSDAKAPVWTNARIFYGAYGIPASPPLPVSGSLTPLRPQETLFTSYVPLGLFVLERRLVRFHNPATGTPYQGLKEVWRWVGDPLPPTTRPARRGMIDRLQASGG